MSQEKKIKISSSYKINEKLRALEFARKKNIYGLESSVIEEHADLLATFSLELIKRPEVISQLRNGFILVEYLTLSPEEREDVENFRRRCPDPTQNYRNGRGPKVLRKQRLVDLTLNLFDKFIECREPFQVFTSTISERTSGYKGLWDAAQRHFGDWDELLHIAAYDRPQILEYCPENKKKLFKKDGINVLIKFFDDVFMEKNPQYHSFNLHFLVEQQKSGHKEGFNAYQNIRNHWDNCSSETIYQWIVEERPDISRYLPRLSREKEQLESLLRGYLGETSQ